MAVKPGKPRGGPEFVSMMLKVQRSMDSMKSEDVESVGAALGVFHRGMNEAQKAFEVRINTARTRRDNALANGKDDALATYLKSRVNARCDLVDKITKIFESLKGDLAE